MTAKEIIIGTCIMAVSVKVGEMTGFTKGVMATAKALSEHTDVKKLDVIVPILNIRKASFYTVK